MNRRWGAMPDWKVETDRFAQYWNLCAAVGALPNHDLKPVTEFKISDSRTC